MSHKSYLVVCLPLVVLAVFTKEYFDTYIPIVAYLALCPVLINILASRNKSDESSSLMPTWFVCNVIGFVGYYFVESYGIV